ncbi:MAG: hypothetical protein ACMG57_04800 [Candidatus Dojkabacteria bacterium]
MQISKSSKNLVLNSQENGVSLEVTKLENNLVIEVTHDGKVEKVERPGEFEIGGVEIVTKEIGRESKSGFANGVFFDIDNVKVLYIQEPHEDIYEWIKSLPFIDLLVVSFTENLKDASNKIDPSKIILFGVELDDAGTKKMGVNEVMKAKQFKFKDSDFDQTEDENSISEVLSLN